METKWLISKSWFDPKEKVQSHGYEAVGYVDTLAEAEQIKEEGGFYTAKEIWAAMYAPEGKIWKFIYQEIKPFKPINNQKS